MVFASGENIRDTALDENGFLHTNFGLGANGDYLAITAVDGSPIHEYSPGYPVQTADVSYGLVDDQQLYFGTPTPGTPNGLGVTGFVADTSFSVKRGYFTEPFDVTFTTADSWCDVGLHHRWRGTDSGKWHEGRSRIS